MTASHARLRLVSLPVDGCWSPGCPETAAGRAGLCGSCEVVYRAALALYHALRARELARLEPGAPGIASIAHRVLVARLLELAPGRDLADAELFGQAAIAGCRPVVSWQLEHLDRFLSELHVAGSEAGS